MKTKQLIPVTLLTIVVLAILTKGYILNLNSVYFSNSGDGLKSYYCAYYHAQYDSTSSHFEGMNYPWGESMSFTDGQTPLANTVRFIDKHLFPCVHKMVGIFNFMMILSVFLSVIFLFLILKKFKLPDWYATILAIGISLLSPQIGRFMGHFSLAWLCWIPMLVYLMIRIIEKESWVKSNVFALVTLLASLMHMYFFLFSAALIGIYWLDKLFFQRAWNKNWKALIHPFIQIVLPFIIIQVVMNDSIADRTSHPYGFYVYKGYPGTVFLPLYNWYAPFFHNAKFIKDYSWEARSYVGIVAAIGFFVMLVKWMFQIVKRKKLLISFTGNRTLDILFWTSIPLLLFSFGLPFILGLDNLQNHIGFISQLRGVARFAWFFYYVMNAIVWIQIYRYFTSIKHKKMGYLFLMLLLAVLIFEGWSHSSKTFSQLNNTIPAINDFDNETDENSWVHQINADSYQAIMPLPYFHIGSESSWIEPKCDILKQMFIVSLKTGLPSNGVMMGRTSLSQTYKNIELSLTPWENYRVLDELPSEKPFLIILDKCRELNPNEERILEKATFILSATNFDLYELSITELKKIPSEVGFPNKYESFIDTLNISFASEKTDCYIKRTGNFEAPETELKSSGEGSYLKYERILEAPIKFDSIQTVYLRFWVKEYDKDMVPRTQLLIIQSTPEHRTLHEDYTDIFKHMVAINKDWALIEIPFELKQTNEIIKVLITNPVLNNHNIYLEEFTLSNKVI